MTVQPSSSSETDTKETPDDATPEGEGTTPNEPDHKAEAEKWKALSRKNEARANENADAAKELADLKEQGKTEAQRQADATTSAEARATKAEAESMRLKVALDKAPDGMPVSKIKKLAPRLTGETLEDLEADAEELFADFATSETDNGNDDGGGDKGGGSRNLPKERLKPGGAPDAQPEETDPQKLAAQVPPRY